MVITAGDLTVKQSIDELNKSIKKLDRSTTMANWIMIILTLAILCLTWRMTIQG